MLDMATHEIKECSINEFNGIIEALSNRALFINESAQGKDVGPRVYLWSEISKAYLVYNEYGDNIVTRILETDLNDNFEDGWFDTMDSTKTVCAAVGKALKFPRVVKDKSEATVNASGIIWTNPKYNNMNVYAYEYDMHLAWLSTFISCKLPDTSVPPRLRDIVHEGEIGFVENGLGCYNCGDNVVFEGYADYIFPIMTNPNPKYTKKLLDDVNNAPNKLARKNKKFKFNKWLGSMQNKNPYIRVAVIAQSNQKIIELINKYKNILVFSVTDSLGATERIPELDNLISNKAGGWSIKSEGYLYTDRSNRLYLDNEGYIKNTVIRGVPKNHITGLNIAEYKALINKIDISKNMYKLDFTSRKVVLNEKRNKA